MTTGKTMALTIQTFVAKVMSLLFNTPSKFFLAGANILNLMAAVTIRGDCPDCLFALNPIILTFKQAWGFFLVFSPLF